MITIEKGIAAPTTARRAPRGTLTQAMDSMGPGDSFAVPPNSLDTIRQYAAKRNKDGSGRRFSVFRESYEHTDAPPAYRCWRTE